MSATSRRRPCSSVATAWRGAGALLLGYGASEAADPRAETGEKEPVQGMVGIERVEHLFLRLAQPVLLLAQARELPFLQPVALILHIL